MLERLGVGVGDKETVVVGGLGPVERQRDLVGALLHGAVAGAAPDGRSRVVTVTSGGMYAQKLDVGDLQTARREYDPAGVYARSKRAQVVLTERWARDWAGGGIVFHATHPGWAATPGVTTSMPRFNRVLGPVLRTPAELERTDIAAHALETLSKSQVREVHVLGRRGPAQAAFSPAELKELVPEVDLTGGGRYPVLGASHHVEGATARHDRVAWAYAAGATARGVHVVQHRPVTGLLRQGDRVVGVETADGPIAAA